MPFQSFGFLALFALTLALCLPLHKRRPQAAVSCLLLACGGFYLCAGFLPFLALLLGICVTRFAGRRMIRDKEKRLTPLVLALSWHLLVLGVVKYSSFLTGGAFTPAFVPLGISFFTFQQIWYLKEVYTGEFTPQESREGTRDFLLFSLFLPTVSSGPILRPEAFFPQLDSGNFLHPSWDDAASGLYAIILGMGKKVLLADSFGIIVNNGYARLGDLTTPSGLLVALGYTLQLYFDFSGYCDMATGLARLLGIRLPKNFDSPYRSLSIGEFWKRWHITLTSFLRECLYFPLGGNRRGKARGYLNLMIIFLVSGLWHGAGWTFLLWGALHGLAMVLEKLIGKRRDRLPMILRWAIAFAFVNLAWIYFRAPSIAEGNALIGAIVGLQFTRPDSWLVSGLFSSEMAALRILLPALQPWLNTLLLLGLYGIGMGTVLLRRNTLERMDTFRPSLWRALALMAVLVWSVLSFSGITTFIYSNF